MGEGAVGLVLQVVGDGSLPVRPRALSHGLQDVRQPAACLSVMGIELRGALELFGRRGPVTLAEEKEPFLIVRFRAARLQLQAEA